MTVGKSDGVMGNMPITGAGRAPTIYADVAWGKVTGLCALWAAAQAAQVGY